MMNDENMSAGGESDYDEMNALLDDSLNDMFVGGDSSGNGLNDSLNDLVTDAEFILLLLMFRHRVTTKKLGLSYHYV